MSNTLIIDPKPLVASFDVDAQKTFTPLCKDELPVPDGHHIADELNAQAHFAAVRIGSKDAHSPHAIWVATEHQPQLTAIGGENVDVCWNLHAVPGTKGFELVDGLPRITAYDYFVWKGIELDMHPYGACYHDFAEQLSTGVIEYLRAKQIKTIIVGGLALEYCVKITVMQLLNAKFNVVVNLGACRGIQEEHIARAKQEMLAAGATFIDSAAQLQNAVTNDMQGNSPWKYAND